MTYSDPEQPQQVDNFDPKSDHLTSVSNHIANFLQSPDIVFLQEIQDNSGETDDGTVDGSTTLTNLVDSISGQGGITYNFTEINPQNDLDGGIPGGNIRVAYLYVFIEKYDHKYPDERCSVDSTQ